MCLIVTRYIASRLSRDCSHCPRSRWSTAPCGPRWTSSSRPSARNWSPVATPFASTPSAAGTSVDPYQSPCSAQLQPQSVSSRPRVRRLEGCNLDEDCEMPRLAGSTGRWASLLDGTAGCGNRCPPGSASRRRSPSSQRTPTSQTAAGPPPPPAEEGENRRCGGVRRAGSGGRRSAPGRRR